MEIDINELLGNLHSPESRLDFLKAVYTPGNKDIADRILAMTDDDSVIEKEITHAKTSRDLDRFKDMAKKHIDHYIRHGHDILIKEMVINWQDLELADYAIAKMTSKSETDRRLEGSLEYSAEIATAFSRPDVAKTNLERLLTLQMKNSEYKSSAAETLTKLGRFDEAINRYLDCDHYCYITSAMELAKKHSPSRIIKIAERGFQLFNIEQGFAEFYVECAQVLGKLEKAEKVLSKYAGKVQIKDSPRHYSGVVKALTILGQKEVAKEFVERIAQHEKQEKTSRHYYSFSNSEEMADLHHAVGNIDAVRSIYVERIETGIREGHHPSNVSNYISKAIKLTGDQSFMEKMLILHENRGEYAQAAILATQLGKPEIARSYETMHQMTQASK